MEVKKQYKLIANVPVSGWEVFDIILANPKSHNLSVCVRTLISRFSGLMSLKGSKYEKFRYIFIGVRSGGQLRNTILMSMGEIS
jgi:hypothetical protein